MIGQILSSVTGLATSWLDSKAQQKLLDLQPSSIADWGRKSLGSYSNAKKRHVVDSIFQQYCDKANKPFNKQSSWDYQAAFQALADIKPTASARVIPLSGMALWASQRILQQADTPPYAFPRYNRGSRTSSNSASAAINKWLRNYVPAGCTMHSFRHSMRDRLRALQCPADIADQIGGWATDGVGQGYGIGFGIAITHSWLTNANSSS